MTTARLPLFIASDLPPPKVKNGPTPVPPDLLHKVFESLKGNTFYGEDADMVRSHFHNQPGWTVEERIDWFGCVRPESVILRISDFSLEDNSISAEVTALVEGMVLSPNHLHMRAMCKRDDLGRYTRLAVIAWDYRACPGRTVHLDISVSQRFADLSLGDAQGRPVTMNRPNETPHPETPGKK